MNFKPNIPQLILFMAGISILAVPFSSIADSVSTTGVQFLKIPAGVRGAGMGGMFTAVADDVSTTYWNSAGLAQITDIELNLLHVSYIADTDYEFFGSALPLQPGSTLGISAAFDGVPSFNSTNNPSSTPGSANDLVLGLGFGQSFGDNFALGIGGKYINSNLVTYNSTGEAMDAGLLVYTRNKELTLGLSVQNVGQISNFSQYSSQEKLPLDYRAGLAYRFQPQNPTHFLVGVELEKPIDGDPIFHAGGELWWGEGSFAAAIRGGYSFDTLNQDLGGTVGASVGAGIRFSGFELNYALVPFGVLGDTQRFSLTYRFGVEGNEPLSQPQKAEPVEVQPQIDPQTGTLKQATFEIKPQARTGIQNWTLEITDPKGNVLKTYSGKGVPPRQITWNGKDTNGNTVSGGIYANYNLKTVDVQGQQVVASNPIFKVAKISTKGAPSQALAQPNVYVLPSLPESMKPVGASGVVKVPNLSFPEKSSSLSDNYLNYLDQVAHIIQKYPNCRVYIEGYACEEGAAHEAMGISQNRADRVLRYLVERDRISPDNLYSRGHGDSSPVDKSGTEEARSKNRRVEILIITR